MRCKKRTMGVATTAFVCGVFLALLLPITVIAVIEGAALLVLGFCLCKN